MYKVTDEKGIAYTSDSGLIVIPNGGTLDDSLISSGYFRQEGIDALVKDGRLKKVGAEKIIAPSNMKMPVVEIKADKKSTKGKKK